MKKTDPRALPCTRDAIASLAPFAHRLRWLLVLALLLLLGSLACPAWEPPHNHSSPRIDRDFPEALEPGSIHRISKGSAGWSREGWLRLTPHPNARPEQWIVSGDAVRFRAMVVAGEGPAVVVLPHLQGTTRIPEYVARRFAREGFQVVALLPPEVALPAGAERRAALQMMHGRIRQGRAAVRVASRELGAPCRVVVGVSVGGMVAIAVAALEDEVDGVVSMLSGGGLGWIAAHSKEPLLAPFRNPLPEEATSSTEAEAAAWADPLSWAPRLPKSRVLLIRALWDQVIPPPATYALWDTLGRPEIYSYPSGHYSFGVFLPRAVDHALEKANSWCRAVAQSRADERVED